MQTNGSIKCLRAADVMFAIPSFIRSTLMQRCGTYKELVEPDENGVVESDRREFFLAAQARVLKQARDLEREVEAEQYRLGRAMDKIYDSCCSKDPNEWGKVTTVQVARMLYSTSNIPVMHLLAVHRQLMDRQDEFVCHPGRHRFVHTFSVRPQSHLINIQRVKKWVFKDKPVIKSFQDKARILIDRSRQLENSTLGEMASSVPVDDIKFDENEQEIVTFLKRSLSFARRIQEEAYEFTVPLIIKDINRYDELITAYTALKFLREIGVYTPWEDIASKDEDIALSSEVDGLVPGRIGSSSLVPLDSSDSTVSFTTEGLLNRDAHETVRHDFGDLPVYVIDDKFAEELDDGISIETIAGEQGSHWLHVHVADPTTLLPITHPLRKSIFRQSETMYFTHQTWPLLPHDIVQACDMGRPGVREKGHNVLTFSAKVNESGDIIDYKVRTGLVRNVIKLRYDDVDEALGTDTSPYVLRPFVVSPPPRLKPDISHITPHLSQLQLAMKITRRIKEATLKTDFFIYQMPSALVDIVGKLPPRQAIDPSRPVLHSGFPKLDYYIELARRIETGARSLVAEHMKLACRVASRFCNDNGIPMIRRTLQPIKWRSDTEKDLILSSRDECGLIPLTLQMERQIKLSASIFSIEPDGHWGLGIPKGEGYVRVTSPLRRVEDLLAHWQIKSALAPDSKKLALTEKDLLKIIEEQTERKDAIKLIYRSHKRQWAHTYVTRFMQSQARARAGGKSEFPIDFNPLRGMEAVVTKFPKYQNARWELHQSVYIPSIGLTAELRVHDFSRALTLGSIVKVNAREVYQYDLNQTLEVDFADE